MSTTIAATSITETTLHKDYPPSHKYLPAKEARHPSINLRINVEEVEAMNKLNNKDNIDVGEEVALLSLTNGTIKGGAQN
ncbi:hypothetical protein SESBI_25090 [Sesbania bispinosa]|nr:hypothetical protein SESBI_25090 [Sesbania bispinosa]